MSTWDLQWDVERRAENHNLDGGAGANWLRERRGCLPRDPGAGAASEIRHDDSRQALGAGADEDGGHHAAPVATRLEEASRNDVRVNALSPGCLHMCLKGRLVRGWMGRRRIHR